MKRVRYYKTLSDDLYPQNEDFHLKKDYVWIRTEPWHRMVAALVYGIAAVCSSIYCFLFLHARFHGAKRLRKEKNGFFLYSNHTQSVGDVFLPALACFPKRIYTVVSPQNYALPLIGKLLPALGALPLGENLSQMRSFNTAVSARIAQKHPIAIFPEAHVWDYCTFIRPFQSAAFKYPVTEQVPAYCMTVTYQKHPLLFRPVMHIYVDGPFFAHCEGAVSLRANDLCDQITVCMKERAARSNTAFIHYAKQEHP
ncbi:MAG: acyl-phosphate glycerol 3-phosphate acyltransferase [Clostridia bacterium]|nr:acyl-phosphate glycerol 3-phosphate acyltransferase [Clostridia bacterium]